MGVLGSFVDKTAFTGGLTSGQSTTYAHNLPADPDFVIIEFDGDLTANTNTIHIKALHDGTNITLKNSGDAGSPSFNAISMVVHSMAR